MVDQCRLNQDGISKWLTLMLLVANLADTKGCKKPEKMTETLANGYSSESTQRESYPMNTNMTGFRWFSKIFASL